MSRSRRAARGAAQRKRPERGAGDPSNASRRFAAGCGRERDGPADAAALAYRELAFPECPACVHRLEPDDAPPFCVWRPAGRPHPFAALAQLRGEAPEPAAGEER